MNFIQYSFSNTYIYSPNTWLHIMRTNYKILITFILLCFLPCLSLSYLSITILTFLIIIKTLNFDENYYYSCLSILVTTVLCLLPYNLNKTKYGIYRKTHMNFPYKVYNLFPQYEPPKIITHMEKKDLFQIEVPYFIIKLSIISIFHSIILKTLLLTTMYEDIILSICTYININNFYIKKIIFISSFASQFLEQMLNRLHIMYISMKLRNINSIIYTNKLSISYYVIAKFLNNLQYDMYKLSSVLYSREFSDEYLEINNSSK